jgi:MATE family multidrug resistance protein
VAVGSGWQPTVAYVNVGCYYAVGMPLGVLLGWRFDLARVGFDLGVPVRARTDPFRSLLLVIDHGEILCLEWSSIGVLLHLILQGIWAGMIGGTAIQTLVLAVITPSAATGRRR